MIKLRYISNARMPTEKAHGIQIVSMARAFAEAGVEVELVIPQRRNSISKDIFSYYGIPSTFSVRKLPAIDFCVGGFFGFFSFILLQWSFARQALADARKNPAQIYYVRDELVFRTLTQGGIPCVYEAHTIPKRFTLYQEAFLRARKIVAISQGLADAFVSLGIPKEHIIVAPDGVRLDDFAVLPNREQERIKLNIPEEECVVLYTGQLYPWKGVDVLIEAFQEGMPMSTRLLVVGGGAGRLEELKVKAGDAPIVFVGQVPHKDIARYLSISDIVVIPNSGKERISSTYTSPLKLFEALAAGKAIVASDLPSLREILSEETAVLVPPDSPLALREALLKVVTDKTLQARLAEAGKRHSLRYDWTARAKLILSSVSL